VNVGVVGGGYVGLVVAAGLAELGHTVTCFESDDVKRESLKNGRCPVHEPGLQELLEICIAQKNLVFVDSIVGSVKGCEVVFIAVGTPSNADGSANINYVMNAAKQIGDVMTDDLVVAVKSTVPVGTCNEIDKLISQIIRDRGESFKCEVVSSPEFLKEGDAVGDFRRPDRIVIGSDSDSAIQIMKQLFAPLTRNHDRFIVTNRESSELGKYAANAMLATRISFMNEMSRISERTGADIEQVRAIVGSDSRIGPDFLYAGPGFGGSCFPKDLRALRQLGNDFDEPMSLINAVLEVNESQRKRVMEKMRGALGELAGKTIAIWGLSFKPGTDDLREAPSVSIINDLVVEGAQVQVFDPMVNSLGELLDKQVLIASDRYEAVAHADLLVLVTEWKVFRKPNFELISRKMRGACVIDTRNIWDPAELAAAGLSYVGMGRF